MKILTSERVIVRAFGIGDLEDYTQLLIEAFGSVPDEAAFM